MSPRVLMNWLAPVPQERTSAALAARSAAIAKRRAEIAEFGFYTPVTLTYHPGSGRGSVEDAHSVIAAQQVGVPVPIVVERTYLGEQDARMRHRITAPAVDKGTEPLSTVRPSEIGLPVISQRGAVRAYDRARERARSSEVDQGIGY